MELIEMVLPTANPVVSNTLIKLDPAGAVAVMKVPVAISVSVVV